MGCYRIFCSFAKPFGCVIRKFFPLDKNYVLEQAQLAQQPALLEYLVDFVKVQYMLQYNSLGLVDETIQRIEKHQTSDYSKLNDLYVTLMGIFRFRNYQHNQLEFGFDGREPFDRYTDEWQSEFKTWTRELCRHKNFLLGVLELTVFYPQHDEAQFIGNRLNTFVTEFFELKIHPQKGILKKTMA